MTAETRGVASASDDAGASRRVGTVETGERHSSRSLTDLGLTEPDGSPAPAGAALLALLRANGRLKRPRNAPEVLALGQALARFFALDAPPFAFDPARGRWVARFAVESFVSPSD